MPRPKPTKEDLKERAERAAQMKKFMKDNLFTEVKLAETLGLSRRTVQMIKSGSITPHPGTIRAWNTLYNRYRVANSVESWD